MSSIANKLSVLLTVFVGCTSALTSQLNLSFATSLSQDYAPTDTVSLSCPSSDFHLEVSAHGAFLRQRLASSFNLIQSSNFTSLAGGALHSSGDIAALLPNSSSSIRIYKNIKQGFGVPQTLTLEAQILAVVFSGDLLLLGLANGKVAAVTPDSQGNYANS